MPLPKENILPKLQVMETFSTVTEEKIFNLEFLGFPMNDGNQSGI